MKNGKHRHVPGHAALIVGAKEPLSAILRRMFDRAGWRVECVLTNVSAIAAAEARPFDIVITSEETTGEEDIRLLRHLRQARPHLKMIILTSQATREEVLAAVREHAFFYFSEPFSIDELSEAVENAIRSPAWDDGIELVGANREWIRLFARCDIGTANRLVRFLSEVEEDLPEEERQAVAMAFRELLLNAMEHGGNFNPKEFVEISYLRSRRAVSCRLKDPGKGFSLRYVRHAAIANPPEDPLRHLAHRAAKNMRPGGYGVLLAHQLVDELIYSERGNEVVLIKYLDTKRPALT
ncbi:MAG TPA: ATP-binding protein [Bryobacteraceae bacterium]|nr:ATP-binding protein [Bryobacteraceae bacterium]